MNLGRRVKELQKEVIVSKIKESDSFYIIGFSGIKGNDFNSLRLSLKKNGARLMVVKNRLLRLAFEEMKLSQLSEFIKESTALVFLGEDIVTSSKVLVEFSKENTGLQIRGGYTQDKVLSSRDIERISKLPGIQVLRAQAVYTLKSPLTSLVYTLNNILAKLVWVLNGIKEKKEG